MSKNKGKEAEKNLELIGNVAKAWKVIESFCLITKGLVEGMMAMQKSLDALEKKVDGIASRVNSCEADNIVYK